MIPFYKIEFNIKEKNAINKVLKSGQLVQSKFVQKFEKDLIEYTGVQFCSVVSSGTAALHTVFMGLGLKKNEGVLIPDYAWPSAANVVALMGGIVISVDVSKTTYNMTPETLKKAIDKSKSNGINLKYLVLIHQFGLISDVEEILDIAEKNKLTVVEDAACALGATYNGRKAGSFGKVAIFSFHPRKTITTGEGGAIVSNDETFDNKIKAIRNHGQEFLSSGSRKFILPGLNYRLTEFQASIGITQLSKLDRIIEKKQKLVSEYRKRLVHRSIINVPGFVLGQIYQTFMITISENSSIDEVIKEMKLRKIETIRGSAAIQNLTYLNEGFDLNNSQYLLNQGLALPLYSSLKIKDVRYITGSLINILDKFKVENYE